MTNEATSCTCAACVALCRRNPGWMTPDEARRAIAAGHAKSLMRDWLEPSAELGNHHRIFVLGPASEGYASSDAPEFFWPWLGKGPCVFHIGGRCALHDTDLKPHQCRTAFGCRKSPDYTDQFEVAKTWDNEHGRETVELWQREVQ